MRAIRRALLAAVLATLFLATPGVASANVRPEPGGGCSGTFVTPNKAGPTGWALGEDITLWNCTGKVHFANIYCSTLSTTLSAPKVCWTYRMAPWTTQDQSVPWYKAVSHVAWY